MRMPRLRFSLKTLFVVLTLSAVGTWLWNSYPFVSVTAANIIFVFAPALPQRWHKCIAIQHVSVGL